MKSGGTLWAGVDVGARKKGFHVAAVDASRLVTGPRRLTTVEEVVAWLSALDACVAAIDSPRSPAPAGRRSRPAESLVARHVCGIRYTPNGALLHGSDYYGWILHGLELYEALEQAGIRAIECFPTASWTRWAGRRGQRSRASWSRAALATLPLADVPARLGQDERDAIAAAVTARSFDAGEAEAFGDIVVPLRTRP